MISRYPPTTALFIHCVFEVHNKLHMWQGSQQLVLKANDKVILQGWLL